MRVAISGLLELIGLIALVLLAGPVGAVHADQGDGQPTIVMVHGAWAGPSSWNSVAPLLQEDGLRTATPRLGLTSLGGDVAIVKTALDQIRGKKILVGHSYGGAVISNVSTGRSDVVALVYSAAFVPDQGDSLLSLGTGFTPTAALAHLLWTGQPFASGSLATIDPAFFPQLFAQDVPAAHAAVLSANQQPIALIPVFVTPSGPVGWHHIPCWYQVAGADRMIDPAEERFMARRACATIVEYPTASHVGGITVHARQFVQLIERAAEATAENGQ
jgi:pimeloyl-ACP methyl ester carboxylesterase